jgi:RNA polymerase sigma factor FliA
MDAMGKFELDRNVKFETYATIRIHGAILDHLRSLDWVPRALRRQARALDAGLQTLEHKLGRTPSMVELAQEMRLSVEELMKLLSRLGDSTVVSLEESMVSCEQQEIPLREALRDEAEGPEQRAVLADLKSRLAIAMAALPEKLHKVVVLYYFHDCTLKEIGAVIGLSEASICHIHAQSLEMLRRHFSAETSTCLAGRAAPVVRDGLHSLKADLSPLTVRLPPRVKATRGKATRVKMLGRGRSEDSESSRMMKAGQALSMTADPDGGPWSSRWERSSLQGS